MFCLTSFSNLRLTGAVRLTGTTARPCIRMHTLAPQSHCAGGHMPGCGEVYTVGSSSSIFGLSMPSFFFASFRFSFTCTVTLTPWPYRTVVDDVQCPHVRRAVRHSSGRCADGFDRAGAITTVQWEQSSLSPLPNAVGWAQSAGLAKRCTPTPTLRCHAQPGRVFAGLRPGRRVCARA